MTIIVKYTWEWRDMEERWRPSFQCAVRQNVFDGYILILHRIVNYIT